MNEILLLLPVKLLLRCKSVSKPWLSHISSPIFVKSHLALATPGFILNDPNRSTTIIDSAYCKIIARHNFPYSLTDETHVHQGYISHHPNSVFKANAASRQYYIDRGSLTYLEPRRYSNYDLLVGSACGIVCVRSGRDNYYLWNPATKQSKLIPSPMLDDYENNTLSGFLGFGFDPIDNDLKIFRIVEPLCYIEVYSSNKNVWRFVKDRPIDIPLATYDFRFCFKGFFCSLGTQNDMLIFDLNKEVLNRVIKLPFATLGGSYYALGKGGARITDFSDSIVVIIHENTGDNCKINLWMLDDEACLRGGGIEASWTLMLNINIDEPIAYIQRCFYNGHFHLLLMTEDDPDWYLYNSVTNDYEEFSASFCYDEFFNYTESLVSIPGSKPVN